jgi:hypothetical protein
LRSAAAACPVGDRRKARVPPLPLSRVMSLFGSGNPGSVLAASLVFLRRWRWCLSGAWRIGMSHRRAGVSAAAHFPSIRRSPLVARDRKTAVARRTATGTPGIVGLYSRV